MVRTTFGIPLAVFALALLAGSAMAQTDDGIRFGIRPTEAFEDRPETFSYFSHELAPGAVLTDAALVVNSGFVPVSLNLYAADGITAVNAGTAFARKGQDALGHSRGTREWLSFSKTEFRLEGAEELTVPFTITVPPDALPGHHVAGLVVEAPPGGELAPGGPGDGQFAAIVVQQAAVAVVIDVPGPHVAGLEITSTCMKTQGDLGATFVVGVHNTGNILLKAEGALSLMDRDGTELASVPLEMDTVLPGDFTTFQVDHPVRLGDGDYRLSDVLNYEGKTAELGEQEFKIRDGLPEVGCDAEEDAQPPASFIEIISPLGGRGSSLVRFAIYGGIALALMLIILALIRRRRARRATPKEPPDSEPPSGSTDGSGGTPGEAQPTKATERASARPSFARRILALIPSRGAGASGPEQLTLPMPPSSPGAASDGTRGEAALPETRERPSEKPPFARLMLALTRRGKPKVSGPEQPSPPMPSFSPAGGPAGTPDEAQPREDPHPGAETPAAFAPPARRSAQPAPEAEGPPAAEVTPGPKPPEHEQAPEAEGPPVADVPPAPKPPERQPAPEAEGPPVAEVTPAAKPPERQPAPEAEGPPVARVTPAPKPPERQPAPEAEVTPAPKPPERQPAPEAEGPPAAEVTPAAKPPEREPAPEAAGPPAAEATPAPKPPEGGDELPAFLLKQLERGTTPPATPPGEDGASSQTAPEDQQEDQSAA